MHLPRRSPFAKLDILAKSVISALTPVSAVPLSISPHTHLAQILAKFKKPCPSLLYLRPS